MVPLHAVVLSVSSIVWITVIIVLVVVFGAAKLPEIARNVRRSAKVLKEELKDLAEGRNFAAPVSPEISQVRALTQAAPKPENPADQSIPHQDN